MASETLGVFLVCARMTTKACGGCDEPFCSLECQKALWPTHKWLCKKLKYTFSFAPLSPLERMQALEMIGSDADIAREVVGKVQIAEKDGWKQGDYESLIDKLAQPDCPINEPLRSHMLIEVHWMIRFGIVQRLLEKDLVLEAADIAPERFKDRRAYGHLGPSHLTVCNAMHRHLLVYWTVKRGERLEQPLRPTLDGEAAVGALANPRVVLVQSALHPDEAFFSGQVVSNTFIMATVDDLAHERTTGIVKEEYRGENYKWPEGWPAVKGWPPS